jgi:hypothetical protein
MLLSKIMKDTVEELEPEQDDEVSICAPPSDEAIHELFPLHKKKRMRLVTFLFRILIMPCFMIQRRKKKWNPRAR